MRNCIQITKLISDSLDQKIAFAPRMEMVLHISLCTPCRRFRGNALAIRRQVLKMQEDIESSDTISQVVLTLAAKSKIQHAINEAKS